jgi:hypothetical protein
MGGYADTAMRLRRIPSGMQGTFLRTLARVDATRCAQYATITCTLGSFRSQSFPSTYLHNALIDAFQSGYIYSKNCGSKVPSRQQIFSRVQRSGVVVVMISFLFSLGTGDAARGERTVSGL